MNIAHDVGSYYNNYPAVGDYYQQHVVDDNDSILHPNSVQQLNDTNVNNNKIGKNFAKSIKVFSNQTSNNVYNLFIETSSSKNISTKDSKGNPTIFNLKLRIDITLTNSKNLKEIKKSFSKNVNFNNIDDKFKLRTTEETLINQMSQNILQEILNFLATIR